MKLTKWIAILALALPFTSNAKSPILGPLSKVVNIVQDYYSFNKVFFNDDMGETLFVDFEGITDELKELNVFRDGEMMMQDLISDLPHDAIYEINLDVFRKGIYTIELVTNDNVKIQKIVIVENNK